MAEERIYEVETVERAYATYRVYAESPEEAERVARNWDDEPHAFERGDIDYIDSIKEVTRDA